MRNRLRQLRKERNWSQAELAERLKVSRQTIIALESSRCLPSLPLAFRISHRFGVRIEDVFFEAEKRG
jgi:putative transcriptional regulator